eukprot:COSAG02_NODE_8439_length_2569_cov_2.576518_2_plen_233_part_00
MQNLASAFPKHARRSATHDLPLSHRHVSIHGREEQLRSRLEAMVPPEFLTALEALQKECGDGLIAARKLLAALDRLCKIAGGVVAVRSAARKVAEADGVVVDTEFIKCLGRLRSSVAVMNSLGFALQEFSEGETSAQRFVAIDEWLDSDGRRASIEVVTAIRDLLELDRSALGQQFALCRLSEIASLSLSLSFSLSLSLSPSLPPSLPPSLCVRVWGCVRPFLLPLVHTSFH